MKKIALLTVLMFFIVGCNANRNFNNAKPFVGAAVLGTAAGFAATFIGGGAGKTVAIVAGSLVGSVLGYYLFSDFSQSDNELQSALTSGQSNANWVDHKTGQNVSLMVKRSYRENDYSYKEIVLSTQGEQIHALVVYKDGKWVLVNG